MPGMFGTLDLKTGTKSAILIPKTAVTHIGQLEYVSVLRDGDCFKQLIRSVVYSKDKLEVITGLSAGDKIVIKRNKN
jgi:HlyD family secretion protein